MWEHQRQFERLSISDDAYALDVNGRKLGRVSQAGGGGMLITTASPDAAQALPLGERMTVTVMEPKTQIANRIDAVVRYHDGPRVGLEFISGPSRA